MVFAENCYFKLPMDCQLDLFEKVISPILLCSCEVWGYEALILLRKVHLKFLKFILNLKSSTQNCMVYGGDMYIPIINYC